jgi:hypothetical protein
MVDTHTTIDLVEAAETIREDAEDYRELHEEVLEKCIEVRDEGGYIPDELSSRESSLNNQLENVEGRADAIESVSDEWGGSEVTLRRLNGSQFAAIQDEVNRHAAQEEVQADYSGVRMIHFVKQSIVSVPEDAPRDESGLADPGQFDWTVLKYLYERAEDLNNKGETPLSRTSTLDRVEAYENGK